LILNLDLPRLAGKELLKRPRSTNSDVPALILASHDSFKDRIQCFELGADDYLSLPFAFAELLARIRALMRRTAPLRPQPLCVGILELDPFTQGARRDGRYLALTAKEFSLLEYLMHNPERTLTRYAILEHVWNRNSDGAPNIVDVHMRHLRLKIDKGRIEKLIHTVHGRGYMLRACFAEDNPV
jgi:DNA-binding response OmpR family regulator